MSSNNDKKQNEKFEYEIENNEITITKYLGESKEVIIPETIEGYLVTHIAYKALQSNQLTSVIIPRTVTTIGIAAFVDNQLTSVRIPESVTHIGSFAFAGNQLTSVTIPKSVTFIGKSSFAGNELTNIIIEADESRFSDEYTWEDIGFPLNLNPKDD